jgi:hypothetical protein
MTTKKRRAKTPMKRNVQRVETTASPKSAHFTGFINEIIENLQSSAQNNELSPKTTDDSFFLFLCFVQTIVAYYGSVFIDHQFSTSNIHSTISKESIYKHHFLIAATSALVVHWCGFAVSCMIQSCKYFDITEDLGLLYLFYQSYTSINVGNDGTPTSRQKLVHILVSIWAVRLVAFVGYRIYIRGSDFRFDKRKD